MGTVETSDDYESCFRLLISFAYCCKKPSTVKMSEAEAQDAFIIFDEAYEGNDVDAFYLGDILRALGCNVTNAAVEAAGGATELGQENRLRRLQAHPRRRQGRHLLHRSQGGLR